MGLGHEKLDVCRLAINYVAWVYEKIATHMEPGNSTPIPIWISISMKPNPNKRMHRTLILRAGDPCRSQGA
jgi:hypothetical protein